MTEAENAESGEVREWLGALDSVEAFEGMDRADALLEAVVTFARRKAARLPFTANTAYVNTSYPQDEPAYPGDCTMDSAIRHAILWNAVAIVDKANKESSELGDHIASYQSAATLHDTGFMHFWRAARDAHGADLIYFQGHISRGTYARTRDALTKSNR
jgi:pyruvate dehydrogenase E1 component